MPWAERLELIQMVAASVPLLLLLDNFEDDLTSEENPRQIADAEMGAFLAAWVRVPGRTRLLVTSRYPFVLPEQAERHLVFMHLGPLSWAETRKLFWRLPGLDALSPADQQRAYLNVGGHPRTLEYLDALLRGGQARFVDVALRMERALAARNIAPSQVWQQGKANLDASLAKAIALAVDDIVLNQLLERLDSIPLARDLLIGASVYRLPIEEIGLSWQIADEQPLPDDPQRDARLAHLTEVRRIALVEGRPADLDSLGLPAAELAQIRQDLAELSRPPLQVSPGFEQAKAALLDLGLLAPISGAQASSYLVHRWTAQALANQQTASKLTEAHRRAANYWHWRVDVWPQSQAEDIEQLLEARYHHHAAGNLDEALNATASVCQQLHTWGAYSWERRLCQEALTWSSVRSRWVAVFAHQLGILAQEQGDYEEAGREYQRALEILKEVGDRAGMASSYHQLGMLAQEQGDYGEARREYGRSLEIKEEVGNRAGMASSYHQLGMLAQNQGDYGEARREYERSLAIEEEVGDRAGMARSYHQLGMLAQDQGDYGEARREYERSLAIEEEVGNRAGIALSHGQLGALLMEIGKVEEAVEYTLSSLLFHLEVGAPQARLDLRLLARQRVLLGEEQFRMLVSGRMGEQNTAVLLQMLDKQESEQ